MRLFSALVSVADAMSDRVLRLLEEAAAPCIIASEALTPPRRRAFVPTNATVDTAHSTLVGRTNSERAWARSVPRQPVVWFHWPQLDLPGEDRRRLEQLCRRISYLGRSTSPALIELVEAVEPTPCHKRLVPREAVADADTFLFDDRVRVPFPGALSALRQAYEATRQGHTAYAWEIGRTLDYGEARTLSAPEEAPGPYDSMVLYALEGRALDGRHTAKVTSAVRRAVLSRAEQHLPALHGHHDGDVVQCAFLGLPFAGFPHADGHLLGVAVALPPLPREELAVVASALGRSDEDLEVTAGALGVLRLRRLSPLDAPRRPRTLRDERWQQPSDAWVTVLPLVLDRYLHRRDDWEGAVRRAVRNSGLPEPTEVAVSRRPLLPGCVDLAPADTLRRPGDRGFKPYCHAVLRFDRPVRGPVVVGSMRHYGLGLCVPAQEGEQTGAT